jgi:hypothetical protein
MNSSESLAYAMSPEHITFYAKIQGTGATPPVRAPTTFSATSAIGYMAASNNWCSTVATDITRASAGVYTMKLRDSTANVLGINADVWCPQATSKSAIIQDYNPTTRVLSFTVTLDSTNAPTDLAAADFVIFEIKGQKSIPGY